MKMTIVFDDNVIDTRLIPEHGFSCLIQLNGKNILFDTGSSSSTLLKNLSQLGIDCKDINSVFLSHSDYDHIGGLPGIIIQNKTATVYLSKSFPIIFKNLIRSLGANVEQLEEPREIFSGVYTTGELGSHIGEQSLIIDTNVGLVIMTGCAHPGVVEIIRAAKHVIPGKKVYLVIGGFHLSGTPVRKIRSIVDSFLELGVVKVAPCHCSGDEIRKQLREKYAIDYIESGVGKVITLS